MTKFDRIAKELGWIKPYPQVPMWYQKTKPWDGIDRNHYIAKFSINGEYQRFRDWEKKPEVVIDEKLVKEMMNYFSGNGFREENKDWVLPMTASDYFYHDAFGQDKPDGRNEELYFSMLAMDNNSLLEPKHFSGYLKDQLEDYKNNTVADLTK